MLMDTKKQMNPEGFVAMLWSVDAIASLHECVHKSMHKKTAGLYYVR